MGKVFFYTFVTLTFFAIVCGKKGFSVFGAKGGDNIFHYF